MFAKEKGGFGGLRGTFEVTPISFLAIITTQHPLAWQALARLVYVLNYGGTHAHQDHVAARKLLWGEQRGVDQARAEASQSEKRLGWVTAWAAHLRGEALRLLPRFVPSTASKSCHAIEGVIIPCIFFVVWLTPVF